MERPLKCPLCAAGSDKHRVKTKHVYGGKPEQAFYHCQNCDVIFLYPGLSSEEEAHFYAAEFEDFMGARTGEEDKWEKPEHHVRLNQPQYARRMKYLAPRLPAAGRILEVGCSSGYMLYPLSGEKYDCVGVEPSGVFSEFVSSKGIPCFNSIDELAADPVSSGGFDVVMHFFVLEHISDPGAFISKQLDLLKTGGKLIIEIPNAADPLTALYNIDAFEKFYWSVAHHWCFSEPSFRFFLDQLELEYEIVLEQRYDLSNHMVWARDSKPGGAGRFTEALGEEIEDQYRQALIRSGFCDTIVAIIEK